MYIIILILALALFSIARAGYSLIVWVPTRRVDLPRILALANLQKNDIVYELGCGTGRVAAFLAKNSSARAIGLELAWPFYLLSKANQLISGQKNLSIRCRDIFQADLSEATVIYVFGIPDKLKNKLRPKLERELKTGTRVISYGFAIAGWSPAIINQPTTQAAKIFVYQR